MRRLSSIYAPHPEKTILPENSSGIFADILNNQLRFGIHRRKTTSDMLGKTPPPRLTKAAALFASVAVSLLASGNTHAVETTTPPVGYVRTELLAQSDTFTAPSLTRAPEFVGTVASVSGDTLTVNGTPNWGIGTFTYIAGSQPNTYYVRIGANPDGLENPLEGRTFTVQSGTGNILSLDLTEDRTFEPALTLTIPAGTKIEIIPYWTLGTLFPASDEGVSFIKSTDIGKFQTAIMFANYKGVGINFSATEIFFYYNNAWRKSGESLANDFSDRVIQPKQSFWIRNGTESSLNLTANGNVATGKLSQILRTNSASSQDNIATSSLPVNATLNELNLINNPAFQASTGLGFEQKDTLLIFSNKVVAKNKSATSIYFIMNGVWKKSGENLAADFGDDVIEADNGFIIRKAKTTTNTSVLWNSVTL